MIALFPVGQGAASGGGLAIVDMAAGQCEATGCSKALLQLLLNSQQAHRGPAAGALSMCDITWSRCEVQRRMTCAELLIQMGQGEIGVKILGEGVAHEFVVVAVQVRLDRGISGAPAEKAHCHAQQIVTCFPAKAEQNNSKKLCKKDEDTERKQNRVKLT